MVQTLDMQWATDAQFDDLVQVRAGHFNADFAADFEGDIARGSSDHDPQLARWFTDVTLERLHALVDYYVATGDLPASKAFLFHNRLNRAAAFLADSKLDAYRSQLHRLRRPGPRRGFARGGSRNGEGGRPPGRSQSHSRTNFDSAFLTGFVMNARYSVGRADSRRAGWQNRCFQAMSSSARYRTIASGRSRSGCACGS